MVVERLRAYYDYVLTPKNIVKPKPREKLPAKMMYYRDGVSEGQFGKVVQEEVSAIKRAFEKVKKEKKWKEHMKLTSIVVTKRHHTRFYPTRPEDMEGKGKNCKPGTVVDTSVTSPYFKEFFLQSHSGLQGTTKPAHYFVIQDDADWDVAELDTFVRHPPIIPPIVAANTHPRPTNCPTPTSAPAAAYPTPRPPTTQIDSANAAEFTSIPSSTATPTSSTNSTRRKLIWRPTNARSERSSSNQTGKKTRQLREPGRTRPRKRRLWSLYIRMMC
jgi:hypothetical protein